MKNWSNMAASNSSKGTMRMKSKLLRVVVLGAIFVGVVAAQTGTQTTPPETSPSIVRHAHSRNPTKD